MIDPTVGDADRLIEEQLDARVRKLEQCVDGDVLALVGNLWPGVDDGIREAVESRLDRCPRLCVVLETSGGSVEVVERIVTVFRKHYQFVEFYVPNFALSAGTVLVMSGDAIHMDYYSVLGPIDPQKLRGETYVPALGYLEQYQRLLEKSEKGELTTAELTFLLEKFDPAELYQYEQERELSISFLKDWLVKYKFKDWATTETRSLPVDDKMREDRAEQIAMKLNETKEWHTHGRGISIDILTRELDLKIDDFGEKESVAAALRAYYKLLMDYTRKRDHRNVIHCRGRYSPL